MQVNRTLKGYVTLYHVTSAKNAESILANGILPRKSKTKRKLVYLCTHARIGWAMSHTIQRHKLQYDQLDVWEVRVRRADLVRVRKALWGCRSVVSEFHHYVTTER